jgi:hypothetical protein
LPVQRIRQAQRFVLGNLAHDRASYDARGDVSARTIMTLAEAPLSPPGHGLSSPLPGSTPSRHALERGQPAQALIWPDSGR